MINTNGDSKRNLLSILKVFNIKVRIAWAVLIFSLVADNVFYALVFNGIFIKDLASTLIIVVYITILVSAYISGHYLIAGFVKQQSMEIRRKIPYFSTLYRTLKISLYVMMSIVLFILLQVLATSQYDIILLVTVLEISFIISTVTLGLQGHRLLDWYKSNRNSIVLLYGLAFYMGAIFMGILSSVNCLAILSEHPIQIVTLAKELSSQFVPHVTMLYQLTYIPGQAAFFTIWLASALLLRQHSKKFGNFKFWTVMCLPVVFYLLGNFLLTTHFQNLLIGTTSVIASLTAGALIFGLVFFYTAKSIAQVQPHSIILQYLATSAGGVILILLSVTSVVLYAPYPPFGIIAWSFVCFASYVFSIGIYSSAVSVSEDAKLRQLIRKSVKEANLIDSIGTAEMELEIQKRVLTITKNHSDMMTQETGVQASLTEEDVMDYLKEVIKEIKK